MNEYMTLHELLFIYFLDSEIHLKSTEINLMLLANFIFVIVINVIIC